MFSFIKRLFNRESLDYPSLMKRGVILIDVRTSQEFEAGHANNTINIPLSDIKSHIENLKLKDKPIITCCRSGMRSGKAASTLKKTGIEAYNGGTWQQVQTEIKK